MEIKKGIVVSMDYSLKDSNGNILDESQPGDPMIYLHGYKNIIPGLESALDGKATGEALEVKVSADDGYGPVNPQLEQTVPKSAFEGIDELQVGMQFRTETPQGQIPVRITKIEGDDITVDGNHPLAGEELHFLINVQELREATAEELDHGHIHKAGGCCGGGGEKASSEESGCCGGGGHESNEGSGCCNN